MNRFRVVRKLFGASAIALLVVGLSACGGGGGSGSSGTSSGSGSSNPPPPNAFATKVTGPVRTLAGFANTFAIKASNGTAGSNTFDWGDTTTSVGLSVTKTYPAPGSYIVTSNTVDSTGTAASKTKNVYVAANPVVAGEAFSCALKNDGTVACWGLNDMGRTGQSFTVPSSVTANPTVVAGLTDVGVLTAGNSHACAIKVGGAVFCWGNNVEGQLGNGTGGGHVPRAAGSFSFTPVAVTGLTDAIAISAGAAHTCAIRRTGFTVVCWGSDSEGQLGRGRSGGTQIVNVTTPVAVNGLSNVVSIATGGDHSCAVVQGGQTFCWGANGFGQLGDNSLVRKTAPQALTLSNASSIVAGQSHTCAIVGATQTIQCWGDNRYGQLGNSSAGAGSSVPVTVSGSLAAQNRALASSMAYSCALRNDGTVACWGDDRATFGTAATIVVEPTAIAGVTNANAVAAGTGHGCAIQTWGDVLCWGSNGNARLGRGVAANTFGNAAATTSGGAVFWHDSVQAVINPLAVVGGEACAIKETGGVQCWSYGGYTEWQTGNRISDTREMPNSLDVISLKSANGQTLCAVFENGRVACGDFANKVVGISNAIDVTDFGGNASEGGCAVLASGKVKCWGQNYDGILGYPVDGFDANGYPDVSISHEAREVPGVTDAISIKSGFFSVCAVKRDKTVMCWGRNTSAELGHQIDETPTPTSYNKFYHTPLTVAGLSGVLDISKSEGASCAVVESVPTNKFYCWGFIRYDGNNGSPTLRLQAGMPNLVKTSAGTNYQDLSMCGIQADGGVRCSAYNVYGGLGIATGINEYSTAYGLQYLSSGTTIPNVSNVTALATTGSRGPTCVLNSSGQLLCWGARSLTPSDPQLFVDPQGRQFVVEYAANYTPIASPSGAIFWRP
jgi:alpha-tubulin suppressor-like RCC1 family protein